MNSRQLEYFKSVCDVGSFSRAALILGVTQPALSKHIRELEEELHVQLFHRTGRGVALTPEGERLLEHANVILGRILTAKNEALQSSKVLVESITIGVTPTIGRMSIGSLTESMLSQFPDAHLHFVEGFSVHLLEWLTAGRVDLALLYDSGAASRLHAEPLMRERLVFLAPSDCADLPDDISLAEIAERPLVLPSSPHGLRPLIDDAAAKVGVTLHPFVEADGFCALIDLVAAGIGCTILPVGVAQREIAAGLIQVAAISEPPIQRTMVLATGTNRVQARGLSSVIRIIKDEIARLPHGSQERHQDALRLAI